MKKLGFMLAMFVCVLASCSDGGSDDPSNPTSKPEEVKTEITIDSSLVTNGLSFSTAGGEQSVSFSVNANWTLSIASTTSGATWCKASATSGSKGTANVKFTVTENTDYDDRSVSVTIKAGTVSKTFTITQKAADALLVTTSKYEVAQEGGQIEIEVKSNINYQMEISETAKDWITESKSKSRALTTHKHKLDIAMNEETEKREGEITFKSGDKVETVKVYQAGGAILLLSQNENTVSDAGETISVDVKSNVEYGVQMPDVDWIEDEASGRGMSSHTLKYVIAANEGYDSRSAEIIFYDKNSDLKDTLKVVQAQKDAIVISKKEYDVKAEGETIEVKLSANVDFEVQIPSDAAWITQTESRALTEKSIYLKVSENTGEENRSAEIIFKDKKSDLSEKVVITQKCPLPAGYADGVVTIRTAGTMKSLLGDDYLEITSLKVVGPINGDDVYYLRKMLKDGKLVNISLEEAAIVEGGGWYYERRFNGTTYHYHTSNNVIGGFMFYECTNLRSITLPQNVTSIDEYAFSDCKSLESIRIPDSVTVIGTGAFSGCEAMESIWIGKGVTLIKAQVFGSCYALKTVHVSDLTSWLKIEFQENLSNPLSAHNAKLDLENKSQDDDISFIEVVVPSGITKIKDYVFYDCSNIEKVIVPNSVTSIGKYAFGGCSLNSVTIGDGVTTIDECAFFGSYALTSVSIGRSVTSIGDAAFAYCEKLAEFYCYATTPPSISCYEDNLKKAYDSFFRSKCEKLYVPKGCGIVYERSNWGKYFSTIEEMD